MMMISSAGARRTGSDRPPAAFSSGKNIRRDVAVLLVVLILWPLVAGAMPPQGAAHDRLMAEDTEAAPLILDEPLTSARAVQLALANNPDIAATVEEVNLSASRLAGAEAARYPTLDLEAGYQHFVDPQRLLSARENGETGVFDRDLSHGELVVRLPLYRGGQLIREANAAALLRAAEENRLARTRQELAFNVVSTFYTLLGQQQVIGALEFSNRTMEEHRHRVEHLLENQKVAKIDLLRTQVRLADLKQNLVRERNLLTIQKHLLANLIGRKLDPEQITLAGTLDLLIEETPFPGDALSAALLQRKDYLAARDRMQAQAERVVRARSGYLPSLDVTGSYGLRAAATGETEDAGYIGLALKLPLFDAGRTSALVAQEQAALAAARQRLRQLRLQIGLELTTAQLDLDASRQRIEASRQGVELAGESLRIEQLKYDLASGSITDVLDVQSAQLLAETTLARAQVDFHIAYARLLLALGEELQ